MTPDIISTLLQASGAAGVSAVCIWQFVGYLSKRDKKDQESEKRMHDMIKAFNQTVNTHMKESNQSRERLTKQLQEFTDTNKEFKGMLVEIYQWNKHLVERNKDLQNGSKKNRSSVEASQVRI